jgi:hypothetical protein
MKTTINIKENKMKNIEILIIPVDCYPDSRSEFGLTPIFTGNLRPWKIKVSYKKETNKAFCFNIEKTKKLIWFPKKAIRKGKNNECWLQFWFKLNGKQLNLLEL